MDNALKSTVPRLFHSSSDERGGPRRAPLGGPRLELGGAPLLPALGGGPRLELGGAPLLPTLGGGPRLELGGAPLFPAPGGGPFRAAGVCSSSPLSSSSVEVPEIVGILTLIVSSIDAMLSSSSKSTSSSTSSTSSSCETTGDITLAIGVILAVCGFGEGLITGRETGVRLALPGFGRPDETGDMMVVSTGINDAVPPFGPLGLGDKMVFDIGFSTADSGADTRS